jgi:hypothetical protein
LGSVVPNSSEILFYAFTRRRRTLVSTRDCCSVEILAVGSVLSTCTHEEVPDSFGVVMEIVTVFAG